MKRLLEEQLSTWYDNHSRKPLLLRGARQVGKSTLVRNFSQNKQLQLVEINLEKTPLRTLEQPGFNISDIIDEIEVKFNMSLSSNKTLLFIDEIQAQPKAITALRYFKEDFSEIPLIAAGSLLELVLTKEKVSFPVGRIETQYLGPMFFSEFLMAVYPSLSERWQKLKIADMTLAQFELYKEAYLKYLFIGGMPEAVKKYAETKSLLAVRKIHGDIIETYRADFLKYSKNSELPKLDLVFDGLVSVLGQKLKYNKINSELKSKDIKRILYLFELARIIVPCFHTNATQIPLRAQMDETVKKLYFLDVGLFNTLMKNNVEEIQASGNNGIKGQVAEQFVAQHLYYNNQFELPHNLFYWLKDKDVNKAEVDFIIQKKSQVIACEVKSEKISRLKSLMVFMEKHHSKLGIKLSLEPFSDHSIKHKISDGTKAVTVKGQLITLPIFCVERLNEIIDAN